MEEEKPKEKDPLDPQTVFTIKESDIPKGITQCRVHSWRKRNDNELECTKCPTCIIVGADNIEKYL